MEIIKEIKEVIENHDDFEMAGYEIITTKQSIKMLIDNEQGCCETWGYFMSEDDTDYFVGANLLDIKITDTALKKYNVEDLEYLDEGGVMFVDFETSEGILQFVAYNAHNGYYGHEAKIECNQLSYSEIL